MTTKPVYLRSGITINDITFIVLEIPRNDDKYIAFTDPNPFLDFTFYSSKTCNTIRATDSDVI